MSLLTETPLFQELTQELVQELTQQAGLEARRQSVLLVLEHKFGTPGEELRQRIEAVNEAQVLDQWLLAAADASSLQAFCSGIGNP